MCTIIALFQVHPDFPLVLGANRDERYPRPSSGPEVMESPPAVVAGRDLERGGTWFGVNRHGVTVAIADQGWPRGSAEVRSRGLLVLDALGCASVEEVSDLLDRLEVDNYAPFSLLYGDEREMWVGRHAGGHVDRALLSPGFHVVVSGIGSANATGRTAYVEANVDPARLAGLDPDGLVAELAAVLQHHAGEADDNGVCRHGERSGTVSSFVAMIGGSGAPSLIRCALGPPCQTTYDDYSGMFGELRAGSR